MPPIEPPTTAAQRSMPSASANARLRGDLVADGDVREPAAPLRRGRGASEDGPGRALAAAEHVRRDDEPAVGVDRRARGRRRRPTSRRCGCPGPAGPTTCESPVRACSTSTALSRAGVERAPGLVGDPHARQRAARLELDARRCDAKRRSPTGSPSRQAPVAGGLPTSARASASVHQGRPRRCPPSVCQSMSALQSGRRPPRRARGVLRRAARRRAVAGAARGTHAHRVDAASSARRSRARRLRPWSPGRRGRPRGPASRSAFRSSMFSSPTERRTRPGVTPVVSCCSGVSCECVVDAGWMTSERTSPMFARWLNSVQALDERPPGVDAALELERQHRADALRRVPVRRGVPGARRQARRS